MFQSLTGRLKTHSAAPLRSAFARFQSLTGRLKTWTRHQRDSRDGQFQSLTGRLKTAGGSQPAHASAIVSIPHR